MKGDGDERRTLRGGADLAGAGLIPRDAAVQADAVARRYAVAVPAHLAALIDPHDPADPIARQFLPDARELDAARDDLADPIGDQAFSPVEGITHRYPDRVLLKPVLVCPVYCRFCFRREVVGPEGGVLSDDALARAFRYIEDRPEIWEVILTGGDPLVLSDRRLADIVARLRAIGHVAVIRIHTRVPIADPGRVGTGLAEALRGPRAVPESAAKPIYVVIHCNHPRELTQEAVAACARLIDAGIPVLSQTVLLKGVNDNAETLAELMRALVRHRIKPYYLHHPDRAPGTAHFRLSIAEGRDLVRALRGRISGLCQPTYVVDIPGGHGKAPAGEDYFSADLTEVTDYRGGTHHY